MSRRTIVDTVASVTAAYVGSDGKAMSRDETKALTDLPIRGDYRDTHSSVGGHAHGLCISNATLAEMIVAAHPNARRDIPTFIDPVKKRALYESRFPIYVLEGTASTESPVLPAGEIAKSLWGNVPTMASEMTAFEQRAALRKRFMKSLTSLKEPPPLLAHTHGESLSFYTMQKEPERRVSSFYLGVAHVLTPELAALHPSYGQLSFVDPRAKTRGVDIATVLRVPLRKNISTTRTSVGLVPTFKGISRQQWMERVHPVVASIHNQMPLANVDFFASVSEAEQAQLRTCQLLTCQTLARMDRKIGTGVSAVLDKYAIGLKQHLAKLGASASVDPVPSAQRDGTVPLCFYLRPSIFNQPGAMSEVNTHLEQLKKEGKISGHVVVRDRPLTIGEDMLTIVLYLKPGV
jgi:hypothetical protein